MSSKSIIFGAKYILRASTRPKPAPQAYRLIVSISPSDWLNRSPFTTPNRSGAFRHAGTMPEKRAAPNDAEMPSAKKTTQESLETEIVEVGPNVKLGEWVEHSGAVAHKEWKASCDDNLAMAALETAAAALREGDHPVAFPTETVYGLGADATSSKAVKGIYTAKGRPSDNPLIVHISDRNMLDDMTAGLSEEERNSAYMKRYEVLMEKFWPGPLTLLIPKPPGYLAEEVTAGLDTVGVRMPKSELARSLIKLANKPIAAPSANSSTKPSPTTAAHVCHDLQGKIRYIVDGGSCDVGVESTVVAGLQDPPLVLRPGGVSIDEIRKCEGWEETIKGYKDESELGEAAPRAPGMKYKHYSPKAKVVLCEGGFTPKGYYFGPDKDDYGNEIESVQHISGSELWQLMEATGYDDMMQWGDLRGQQSLFPKKVGIIRTQQWEKFLGWIQTDGETEASNTGEWWSCRPVYGPVSQFTVEGSQSLKIEKMTIYDDRNAIFGNSFHNALDEEQKQLEKQLEFGTHECDEMTKVYDVMIGPDAKGVATWLFAALREMDKREVDIIYVEGITDDGGIGAAVMNRLRKAATDKLGPTYYADHDRRNIEAVARRRGC